LTRVKGKARLDLTINPPPDLIVEIDITNSSLDKLVCCSRRWVFPKSGGITATD
jgi:hypothetical protein